MALGTKQALRHWTDTAVAGGWVQDPRPCEWQIQLAHSSCGRGNPTPGRVAVERTKVYEVVDADRTVAKHW